MAIVINGSGTVTGLSVGGLPDGTVDADTLASGAGGVDGITSTADATAMTIDSSESVGINNSTGFGTYSGTGVKYSKGDGTFFVGRDGGQPLWLNRETSQGDLIGLAAAGSTHARIGTTSNALVLKTGTGGNTERMRIDSDGHITMPSQSAFEARTSNALADISINTAHTIAFNTERYDVNGDFNTSTHTFTAPVTGKYMLNTFIRLQEVDADAIYYHLYFVTSNRTYFDIIDPRGFDTDLAYMNMRCSVLADMDASDTAYVQIYQAGGAAQTDVAANDDVHFSGFLAC
jgi:hypothetical protein